MPLKDSQIERYSRQIIVPRFGGGAQERLLSFRLLLAGEAADVAEPLAYMVGAGVGTIHLMIPDGGAEAQRLCAEMRGLNPDSTVLPSFSSADRIDLAVALIGSRRVLEQVRASAAFEGACVAARLDPPEKVAILPAPPPCIRCADADILAEFGENSVSGIGAFVAMLATAEALKIAAHYEPMSGAARIQFHGYTTTSVPLAAAVPGCACAADVEVKK